MKWDERYQAGTYPTNPEPSPALRAYLNELPDGRALDMAAGSGRNALFLAANGYRVDALDQSSEGLSIIDKRARARGSTDRAGTIRADATTYEFSESTYDLVTISYFRTLDRPANIKAALKPGGILFYQHHLRVDPPATVRPSTDRYRFDPNELLCVCFDLAVLYYDESTEPRDDRQSATVTIIARNAQGGAQPYPQSRAYK